MKKISFSLQPDTEAFELALEAEKKQVVKMRPAASFWKDGFGRLFHNPVAIVCMSVLLILLLLAIFVPIFWPYEYSEQLAVNRYAANMDFFQWQSMGNSDDFSNVRPFCYSAFEEYLRAKGTFVFPHIFGTDDSGRDFFIRVVYGTRVSLAVGLFASFIVFIIGTIYGSVSGFFGGKVDMIMMRVVDIIYSLPEMLIIILLSVVLKQTLAPQIAGTWLESIGVGMISIFIVYGLLYWVRMARMVRGQIISIKQQEFVLAARTIGTKPSQIIFKHLLPNCVSIIIIMTALQIPSAIFTESFLSYVGLGVALPMPSLGSLASDASKLSVMTYYSYRLYIPAITICMLVLAFNLLGDSLRDAFDPRLRK